MKELINQSLLLQEAKHTIKSPKMYDQFSQEADRFWREDQLPQLQVEFARRGRAQLREKLKEHGRSFDTISQMTRRGLDGRAFLHAKLKDKIKADLPELLKYYDEHMHDKEYDRPAADRLAGDRRRDGPLSHPRARPPQDRGDPPGPGPRRGFRRARQGTERGPVAVARAGRADADLAGLLRRPFRQRGARNAPDRPGQPHPRRAHRASTSCGSRAGARPDPRRSRNFRT